MKRAQPTVPGRFAGALVALVSTGLGACASQETLSGAEYDPWEGANRTSYAVNDAVDRAVLKPVAKGYRAVVPRFMRIGISNFSDNLTTPRSALNNFLQGKPKRGFTDIGRFLFNSTFGLAGLIDVASDAGLEEYNEDFGQTLAVWGVGDGPYVYLPIFGPRTLRDALMLPLDYLADPLVHHNDSSVRDKVTVLRAISTRYRLFTAESLIEDSQDPYISIREAYLQNRQYDVYDGEPPVDDDFYDDFDDFEDED